MPEAKFGWRTISSNKYFALLNAALIRDAPRKLHTTIALHTGFRNRFCKSRSQKELLLRGKEHPSSRYPIDLLRFNCQCQWYN